MTSTIKPAAQPLSSSQGANTYSDLNGLAALKKDSRSPEALHAVAQQIDALFLQMMLKSMRDASAAMGQSDSNEMGMYQDMFDKQISLSMSQHGGLGLGAQLTRQMSGQPANVPSAASSPAVSTSPPTADAAQESVAETPGEFVSQIFPSIQRVAQTLGVNPIAMLAQAVLETGWGKRMARAADGTPSRNMFGIKADDHWNGARMGADTVEFSGGVATQRRTAFRAYGSIEESVSDFAHLLSSSPRYREAMAAGQSADSYIAAIGKSGYATDPAYAEKLKEIMNSAAFRGALSAHRVVT